MRTLTVVFIAVALAISPTRADVCRSGPFSGLDVSKSVPAKWQAMVVAANEDCSDVEEFRLPRHARPYPLEALDGGSRLFEGDGYVLLLRKSLWVLSKIGSPVQGYLYGYELYFGSPESIERQRPMAARVWFVSASKMAEIDRANAEQLEKRIGNDWLKGDLPADGESSGTHELPRR